MFPFLQNRKACLYTFFALLLALGIKFQLAKASVSQLDFLLWLPAKFVSVCFSSGYRWDPEQGYVFPELGMYINKGCAAINFLVILFLTLTTLINFQTSGKIRLRNLGIVFLLSYPLCLLVNSFRILVSVQMNFFAGSLSLSLKESLHEFTGTLCFFSALLLIMLTSEKILRRTTMSTLSHNPSSL